MTVSTMDSSDCAGDSRPRSSGLGVSKGYETTFEKMQLTVDQTT
jgi:hypothetical protein